MENNTTETGTATYAGDTEAHDCTTSAAVVEAVAEAEDISPAEVRPPLYEAVDPDALDDLFAARSTLTDRSGGYVIFPFCGYEVTVYGNGDVTLSERFDGE